MISTFDPKSPLEIFFNQSHAFIIGINDYVNLSSLDTAVNDAQKLAKQLGDRHGYNVHSYTDNPTLDEIREIIFETIPQTVSQKKDRILFYFAGHGLALDGDDGPNGYLVPSDAKKGDTSSLVSMKDLHDVLTGLPCKHGLIILDCCFSGAFKWSMFRDVINDTFLPRVVYHQRFKRYCSDHAWQVLCSSAYDQKALDVLNEQSLGLRNGNNEQHSPFAKVLFDALEGKADVVPVGGDGLITATELYVYLREKVEDWTTKKGIRQTPSFFSLKGHDKGEYIFLTPDYELNLPSAPNKNPYKGLNSYEIGDEAYYFGRDKVVKKLLKVVSTNNFVVVTGASGVGKSSLIKAGILPKLKSEFQILPSLRPGKTPMVELEQCINNLKLGTKYVLLIDQFEELITQSQSHVEALAFQERISNLLKKYIDLKILISIRSDFEPQFEQGPLRKIWQKATFSVPAFSTEELREIIVRPAVQEVLVFKPESLVNKMIDDVNQAPGALPLLSFTLSELYHTYLESGLGDRALKEKDYDALGGVIGSLRTKAEELYFGLDSEQRHTMRRLMLRMVSLEGGEIAGRRVLIDELVFKSAEENDRVKIVLEEMVNSRLIVRSGDNEVKPFVEPAHDALVRAWALLWDWIKSSGEEKIILQNKLGSAVEDYQKGKGNKELLWYKDPRLDLLKAENESKDSWLNKAESVFVEKSLKRRTVRRRQTIGGLILISVILGMAALIAFQQAEKARSSAAEERIQRKEAQKQTKLANENLIQAYEFQIGVLEVERDEQNKVMNQAIAAGATFAASVHAKEIQSKEQKIDSIRESISQIQSGLDSSRVEINFD